MRRVALAAAVALGLPVLAAGQGMAGHPGGGGGMMGGGMMSMMMRHGGMGGGAGAGMMGGMGWGTPMGGAGMMGHMGHMMSGMMSGGLGMLEMLDLTDKQRARIRAIRREAASQVRRLWVEMADEADRLRDLYAAERPDPKAIGEAYARIFGFKRKMIETSIAARNRVMDVLTPEQRKRLRQMRRAMRMRGMMGGMGQGAAAPGGHPMPGPGAGRDGAQRH